MRPTPRRAAPTGRRPPASPAGSRGESLTGGSCGVLARALRSAVTLWLVAYGWIERLTTALSKSQTLVGSSRHTQALGRITARVGHPVWGVRERKDTSLGPPPHTHTPHSSAPRDNGAGSMERAGEDFGVKCSTSSLASCLFVKTHCCVYSGWMRVTVCMLFRFLKNVLRGDTSCRAIPTE